MIANYASLLMDKTTGEQYVSIPDLTRLFEDAVFRIPKEEIKKIHTYLRIYRDQLYSRLKELDHEFYVLVEQKPGQGFERVIPATPVYHPDRVSEVRNSTLREIELMNLVSVKYTYSIDPTTLALSASILIPTPVGNNYAAPLELCSYQQLCSNLVPIENQNGRFYIVGEEAVIPS